VNLRRGSRSAHTTHARTHRERDKGRRAGGDKESGYLAVRRKLIKEVPRAREMAAAAATALVVVVVMAVLAALVPAARGVDRGEFPAGFLFGAATSAYQVSGWILMASFGSVVSLFPPAAEKFAIMGLQTMGFAIIGLQSSTSLKRPLKRWHFAIIGFLVLLITFLNPNTCIFP
jgi:putative exporter of polyketide antibiotics